MHPMLPQSLQLAYRRIDPDEDALLAYAHHRAACVASFGTIERAGLLANYAQGLKARVEEFPEGNVIAMASGQCVGQLDLQAPYGLPIGYINLYYVRAPF